MALPDPDVPFFWGVLLTPDAHERRGPESTHKGNYNSGPGEQQLVFAFQLSPHYASPCTKSC